MTIRFTILVRILQDPQLFFEDLSRILKYPVSDLEKILIKIFEDSVKIFEGSLRITQGS